jgi:hypothetical protein
MGMWGMHKRNRIAENEASAVFLTSFDLSTLVRKTTLHNQRAVVLHSANSPPHTYTGIWPSVTGVFLL